MKALRLVKVLSAALCVRTVVAFRPAAAAWDWLDYVVGDIENDAFVSVNTLTLQEIGELRVRDIKRRLTRIHGYSADEVGRMLDKKELINTLAFEEHKTRERKIDKQKRCLLKRGVVAALIAVAVAMCWPLLSHAYEVALVNFVVFTDRKQLEARRCFELQSIPGFIGVILMFVVDGLQLWLSVSIILSWVMKSKYFFPVPSLPIHPAQFMGGQVANGPFAKYGFNIGPMLISWGLRFLNGTLERWTGRALSNAQQEMRRKNRENETQQEKEERAARKAARKAARQAAREQQANAPPSFQRPPGPVEPVVPASMNDLTFQSEKERPSHETASVEAFLGQEFCTDQPELDEPKSDSYEEPLSALDDLD